MTSATTSPAAALDVPGPASGRHARPDVPGPASGRHARPDVPGPASGRHARPDVAGSASGRHARPEAPGSTSGRLIRPRSSGLLLERACPEPAAATHAEQAARDAAWRRGVGAVAQLGAVAAAVDVELRAPGALRSLRLFDVTRDAAGLPAALRALDGLRGEVQRVHVTLRSSKLRVLTFDRAEAPRADRAAA